MELTNKALTSLLVLTVVVSLGGTLISINTIMDDNLVTGKVTANATEPNGTIVLDYAAFLAINLSDNTVTLGTLAVVDSTVNLGGGLLGGVCNTSHSTTSHVVNLENVSSLSTGCFESSGDEFQLDNVGTISANVSTLINSNITDIICKSNHVYCRQNAGVGGQLEDRLSSCSGSNYSIMRYLKTEDTASSALLCTDLEAGESTNMSLYVFIPGNATGGSDDSGSLKLTFAAVAANG